MLLLLAGCSETVTPVSVTVDDAPAQASTEPDTHSHDDHDHALVTGSQSVSRDIAIRLARLNGHVAAGLALYRAGNAAAAQHHLQHPISDQHAAERTGLDAIGLQKAPFQALIAAIRAGKPADEARAEIAAVESHLLVLAERAGGDPLAIVRDLVATVLEKYETAVPALKVENAGLYQDALGFALVARHHANSIKGEAGDALRDELDALLALWQTGPLVPAEPATLVDVSDQADRVRGVLRYAR